MNGDPPASPCGDGARPRLRRMDVRAAMLVTAVFAFAASAETESLHDVAKEGDVAAVARMLDRGADFNADGKYGSTPLHEAAEEGHHEVASLLLDRGADPNAGDWFRHTPLHRAAAGGHHDVVALLLDRGADPNAREDEEDQTPLHEAATAGGTPHDVVALLLDRGADPNARTEYGSTSRKRMEKYVVP